MKKLIPFVAVFAFSVNAFAEEPAAAPAMDMTKMGPMTRMPKMMDQKGVDALYMAYEEAHKKGDINMAAEHMDFPMMMATDDANGLVSTAMWTKEQWMNDMKPMFTS